MHATMMSTRLALIAAHGPNWQIGKGNQLLWKVPEDMKLFKETTMGFPIIMGRKTWDSIGAKPLPGRTSIVVSRSAATQKQTENVHWCDSLGLALMLADELCRVSSKSTAFVIGGAEIYTQALGNADDLYLTLIDDDAQGDTYFPAFSLKDFAIREERPLSPIARFRRYQRKL
jgi:dihydrofolate reductase